MTKQRCSQPSLKVHWRLQGSTVVQAPLQIAGQEWSVTCVSMGNPHAVVFGKDGSGLKVTVAAGTVHCQLLPALPCTSAPTTKGTA